MIPSMKSPHCGTVAGRLPREVKLMAESGLEKTVYADHPLQGEDSTPIPGTNLSDCVAKALSADQDGVLLTDTEVTAIILQPAGVSVKPPCEAQDAHRSGITTRLRGLIA
jgi:hypothetical protein